MPPTTPPVAFVGLGHMGLPMATNLLAAGFPLRVYNRTPAKAAPLLEKGATLAHSPADAVSPGGVLVTILSDDAAVESVADDATLSALGPGGVHLSMSTILPATSVNLAAHHARLGPAYVAAPVFGRPDAAAEKKLWICTSGPADAKSRIRPLLDAMGQGVFDFGQSPGAANVVKLAGNFLLTAAIEAMAEASALAENNGIPRADLLHMLTQTLFNCQIYNGYSQRVIKADFDHVGFAARLALKDMRLARQTAVQSHTPMPMLDLLVGRYLAAVANHQGDLDASILANAPARDAGLKWF